MVYRTSDNNFGTAKWIVDATAGQGTHTTIAAALTSASSGETIFIRPGTYTENLTLKSGVNICAFECDGQTPNVSIIGKCSYTGGGNISISGIYMQTNSDYFLSFTGTSLGSITFIRCKLFCSNNTGIQFTNSNASSFISILHSTIDITTTGITLYTMSSSGSLNILYSYLANTGSSTTASTNSAGVVNFYYVHSDNPISSSSTGGIALFHVQLNNGNLNTTQLTTNGTGTHSVTHTVIQSGTASAVSVGAGATLGMFDCAINSSNTNPITGAGTFNYGGLTMFGTGLVMNPSSMSGKLLQAGSISFDGGTNNLSTFTDWTSWTPTIDGAVSGSTTYTTQFGTYTRIGNIVFASFNVVISAATGTGNMILGGLPFTVNATGAFHLGCLVCGASYTYPAGVTNVEVNPQGSSKTAVFSGGGSSVAAGTLLQMQNTAITIKGMCIYRI